MAYPLCTGETPHRCDFCSKTFTRKEHLLNHVRQHTNESPHRLVYSHFNSNQLMRYINILDNNCCCCCFFILLAYRCTYCMKTFTRKEHLVNHIRQHTGETPFSCEYCPKAFTRKDHLGMWIFPNQQILSVLKQM